MVTYSSPEATCWAVIIGSGVATERSLTADSSLITVDRSLDGAVEDVAAIENFLTSQSQTIKLDIKSLKGSKAPSTSIAGAPYPPRPAEEAAIWPTFNNVCAGLMRIIQLGIPGDRVYIHFSGHGTRRRDDGAVAMVLYDPICGVSYLSGTQLRQAIHRMVEKRLLVTLVLDCCFSGSVLRATHGLENSQVRFIEYDPDADVHQKDNVFQSLSSNEPNGLRDSTLTLGRFLDPKGYAIFTACGPHETAHEVRFQDGVCRGAFSYFWTDSLATFQRRGASCTHQPLHQHIRARFRCYFHQQTPMLFGNKDHHLFGVTAAANTLGAASLISVYRENQSGRLILDAGQAHGVHQDDVYALYPSHAEVRRKPSPATATTTAKVIAVDSLTSELQPTNSRAENHAIIQPGTPWKADLLTSLSPQKIFIHTAPEILSSLSTHVLPPYLDFSSTEPPLFLVTAPTPTTFTITPTSSTSSSYLFGPPTTILTTATTLLPTLDHLSRYKFFERLDNRTPSPTFESSFSLEADPRRHPAPGPDGVYEVAHGTDFVLRMTNRSVNGNPCHVALFLLSPVWEVRNLVAAEGGDATLIVEPCDDGGEGMELPLEMTVPPPRGGGERLESKGANMTEDVIKVFVLAGPAAFPAVVLGPLVVDGDGNEERGGEDGGLGRVLEVLDGQHGERDGGRKGWWCCKSFSVRTLREGGGIRSVG
ncbi:hypothetical protein QBC36DRAFT_329259 [Triangularia setosa]|uniref:Peptidase C14 caspase domain-containing protein n=1 Tax=Triangularia setosa TaxID=2587417 RepID=A0AAN7A7U6_9PEZI|nr:hypothetical protein QBC36DRAFT_329259 [Podospora setosa]